MAVLKFFFPNRKNFLLWWWDFLVRLLKIYEYEYISYPSDAGWLFSTLLVRNWLCVAAVRPTCDAEQILNAMASVFIPSHMSTHSLFNWDLLRDSCWKEVLKCSSCHSVGNESLWKHLCNELPLKVIFTFAKCSKAAENNACLEGGVCLLKEQQLISSSF